MRRLEDEKHNTEEYLWTILDLVEEALHQLLTAIAVGKDEIWAGGPPASKKPKGKTN